MTKGFCLSYFLKNKNRIRIRKSWLSVSGCGEGSALRGECLRHLDQIVPLVEEVLREIVDQLRGHAGVMISRLQSCPVFDLAPEETGECWLIHCCIAGRNEFLDLRLGSESPVFPSFGVPMDGVQGSRPAVDAGFDDGVRILILHEAGGGDIDEGRAAFGTGDRL